MTMMSVSRTFPRHLRLAVLVLGMAMTVAGPAAPAGEDAEAAWDALGRPGAVAIMRHALAPGTGDPAGFRIDDCSTQRTLDARGRAQARKIGAEMRARGVRFDRVLTSRWCRCRETARLMDVGPVEAFPVLDSFFADRRANGPRQTAALRDFLDDRPAGERILLVTHQVNITALTGRGVTSGEVVVLDPAAAAEGSVAGTIALGP